MTKAEERVLLHAAKLLESQAAIIVLSYMTADSIWPEGTADEKAEHDELIVVAAQLRLIVFTHASTA